LASDNRDLNPLIEMAGMMMDLARYFSPLAEPMGLVWLFHLLAAAILFWKRRWLGAMALAAMAGLLMLAGSTSLPKSLLGSLERPYARSSFGDVPVCDAVVALGGGQSFSPQDVFGFKLTDGGERIITALELMRQHKGRALVLGGGYFWHAGKRVGLATLLRQWLKAWELPGAPVYSLDTSATTQEEARNLQKLAREQGWQRVILVTSAAHMRRAEAVFKNAGVSVIPVGCDFRAQGIQEPASGCPLIPRLDRFDDLGIFLHEQIGWFVYRCRGWTADHKASPVSDPKPLVRPPPEPAR
jgi:uncharacterized SAM-binding protein YcdF (DUF218 family)